MADLDKEALFDLIIADDPTWREVLNSVWDCSNFNQDDKKRALALAKKAGGGGGGGSGTVTSVNVVGGTTGLTTSGGPVTSSGVITLAGVLNVANGGTGRNTGATAYGLVAAGTTATGAQQTLPAGATTEMLVGGGASALPVWTTSTGSGAPVRANSPTLVTPNLGTPSTLVGTNITGLPLTTGVTGILPVANGGTGRNTGATAYGLLAAGTTATGVQQTLAAGATTEILVGGGASALPVWTTTTGTGAPVRSVGPTLDSPIFTGQSSPAYAQGKLVYDTTNECLTFFNNDSAVALQIGQEFWIRVRNVSGSTIANGATVYINGTNSGLPSIALAQANTSATTVVAGLATESIPNGSTGWVTALGLVRNVDTSAFSAGQTVYLSASVAGGLTATAPTAPNFRYRVGIVITSNASTGQIHVTQSTGALGNGTANQVFGMNNGGTAQEVKSIVGGTGITVNHTPGQIEITASGGGASAGGTTGSVQFNNGSGGFAGLSNLLVNTTSGVLTETQTALGTTPAAGIILNNTTAATSGNQQVSPAIVWEGQGWKSTATAASQPVQFYANVLPVQGTSAPSVRWVLSYQINGAGLNEVFQVLSNGQVWATAFTGPNAGTPYFVSSGNNANSGLSLSSVNIIGWASGSAGSSSNSGDTFIGRGGAAATVRLGLADAASPAAQTLKVQSVSSGTSNTAGANWTIQGSQGTGTGVGGDIIFETASPGGSGSTPNAHAAHLTLKGGPAKSSVFAGPVVFPSYAVSALPAAASYPYARAFVSDATAPAFGVTVAGGGAAKTPVWSDGTNWIVG